MINKTQQIPAPTVKDNYYYVAIFERTLREYIIEWYSYDFYTGKPVSFTTLSGNYDDDIGFLIKQNYPSQDKQKTREFTYGLSKDPYLWTFSENNITETAIGIRKENLGNMLKKAKELNSSSDSVVNNTTIKIYSVYAKSAREYNVTFYVEEKPKNQIFKFGSLPEFSGDVPNKPSDSMVYTFEGWYHQKISYYPGMPGLIVNNYFIDPVDKDLVFYAMFSSVPRMMKVEFLDYNGNVIYSRNDIAYGAAVTISTITNIDLRTPSKPSDSQYYYIFRGWDGGVHAQNSASLVNDNYIAHADADLIGNQAIMPYFEKVHIPTFEGQKSNGKLKVVILQSDKDFSATYRWERKNTITGNWDLVASTRDKNYSVTAVPEAQYQVIITHDVTAQLWTRTVTDFTEVVGPGPVDPDGSDFPIAIVAGAAGGALAAIAGIFLVVHFLKKRRLGDGDELF